MTSKSWMEICDKAVYLLFRRGVPEREVMACLGINKVALNGCVARVESGRYGERVAEQMRLMALSARVAEREGWQQPGVKAVIHGRV